ncbi:MAG: SRPBCC family protein [Pseudonocardiaceae bacterium]
METIHHDVWINANPKTVFDAITTRAGLDAWWGKALSAEPEIGYVVEFDHKLGDPLKMRITNLVADERLEWRCVTDFSDPRNPASEWLGTRFVFDLETEQREWVGPLLEPLVTGENVTILHFRQTGWPSNSRWYGFCNWAWGEALGTNLKKYCESEAA